MATFERAEDVDELPARWRPVREGAVPPEDVHEHQEWGAAASLNRERMHPPPGVPTGEPDLRQDWGASATLAGERWEPPPRLLPRRRPREDYGASVGLAHERREPPPAERAATWGEGRPRPQRPVAVTERNRPPGDPGADVDVQDLVGGQRGRPDPGITGGPTWRDLGHPEREERAEPIGLKRYRKRL